MLMYLNSRVAIDLDDKISLHFMITGQTKNVVDGAFGYIKRKLNKKVKTSKQMMEVIEGCSVQTQCVPAKMLALFHWKD